MMAEPAHLPAVFHCTAGKDRTGLTAALVLSALGVDDGQVLDDYELSNRFRSAVRLGEIRPVLAEKGIDIERYLPLFTAPRRSMAAALAGLRATYGSVEDYLTGPAGAAPADLEGCGGDSSPPERRGLRTAWQHRKNGFCHHFATVDSLDRGAGSCVRFSTSCRSLPPFRRRLWRRS